ncbi:ribonucleotide-diphosphate reductase subunit beta [Fervidibacillus halotolerans]|uniref:Ribonucleoside-diphosphate reductase subunit beta n=1 Tax=Fervidibacillus halotolerans TaxID=2980027 RepID=A0A9E8RX68_9BACI|nr:ribonucleotide-diphosphate reductase subunit beta [Fervidibacillus halotolerans]WAA12465.1 ribonucleotide-diphosphate reductase subunit beta [Fervidibacillus halotolerans]
MQQLLYKVKTLKPRNPNRATHLFGGKASGILNWNDIKYPHWYKIYKRLLGNYWQSDEINMSSDVKQFPTLSKRDRDTFLKIISLLATFDSSQTRTILLTSLYATDPSVQAILAVIAQQEAVHNESYSSILSSIVPLNKQNEAFEIGRKDPILLKRNQKLMEIYNQVVDTPTIENIVRTLVYSTLLEGLFFYSGFAFFYHLARRNKMIGTSTMISYINRDELEHGRFISELIRATLAERTELNTVEFVNWIYTSYQEAVDLEIEWSNYVLGHVTGIDLDEMAGFIKCRANKMLRMMRLAEIYPAYTENPMKWIRAYVDNFDDTKTDFFEQKSRTYTKVSSLNGFDEL